jgi:AcrR family transcriptional regulator
MPPRDFRIAAVHLPLGYPRPVAPLPEHLSAKPAGRHRLSREVMTEHQRERVLDAAIGVFAKRGFQGTTVDHIVGAGKIGVGSFYEHFENKEACFLAAYDRILAEGREQIVAALPPGTDWPEQVCAVLRALLGMIAAEPLRARIMLVEAQTAGKAALARYEETIDSLVPLLRRGRDFSPVAAELPSTLEVATLGGLLWFLQQRIVLGELDGAERLLPEAAEILLEPYIGQEDTARFLTAGSTAPLAG